MDLQADIEWIQRELQQVKDPTFIAAIKNMLRYRQNVTSDRISIEQYNQEIDASIADISAGRVHTHESVREQMKTWGRK